jgi:hypothetical protein
MAAKFPSNPDFPFQVREADPAKTNNPRIGGLFGSTVVDADGDYNLPTPSPQSDPDTQNNQS